MITLNQLSLSRGNKLLLNHVSLSLQEKQKIGLIGHNGCGKSSFFSLLLGELTPDTGECHLNPQLRIAHLSQRLPDSEAPALDFVLAGDTGYMALQHRLNEAQQREDHEEVVAIHEKLTQTGAYGKPAIAASIMAGLGFEAKVQNNPVNSFSGGWRMRLSLARCLMNPADLLLLDEPTNHLDMEAIVWLEKWLKQSPVTLLLISHDREFLDAFVSHILHVSQQKMTLYTGNYSTFEQTRALQLALQEKMYVKQQEKISHLMSFVTRFRAKATKAKQAQSRLNTIAKMEVLAKANLDSPFAFEFFKGKTVTNPLIRCENVVSGYDLNNPIIKKMNLVINKGDRLALLGPNGEGKSTLIKTLLGEIPPFSGSIHRAEQLKIGYYAQHQLEALDFHLSPLETIQALSPEVREQSIRDYLGGFNFIGDQAVSAMLNFSGGEKARLALAKLVWEKPNLLLLDEPTNHLDLEMRAALEIALQSYEGALLIISHDRHLLKSTVDGFYLMYQKALQPFEGDLQDYHTWLLTKDSKKESKESASNTAYRERKTLQNRLKKLETEMGALTEKLRQLEHALAEAELYEKGQESRLQGLLAEQGQCQQSLVAVEEEWLMVSMSLEDI